MKLDNKRSISSRASVRSLVVACLPAAAVAFVADSPALGAAISGSGHQGLTVDDNNSAGTNAASTNSSSTNADRPPLPTNGVRG